MRISIIARKLLKRKSFVLHPGPVGDSNVVEAGEK